MKRRAGSTERPRMSDVGSTAEEPMVYLTLRWSKPDSNPRSHYPEHASWLRGTLLSRMHKTQSPSAHGSLGFFTEPGAAHLVPIGFAYDRLGQPGHPRRDAAASFGGRGPHLTRPQRCVRPVPSLAPSEQRAKTIPPSTPGPTEVSLCAPRSVQGGKDAEKRRADLDYPCRKPAAAARSPRNDQREGGRPAFRPFALSRTGQERCPGSRRKTSCGWDRHLGRR